MITSCGGMFSVIVRRSTLTIRSTIGISRKRPGPFGSGSRRPSRKMMPRSYSRATLTAANRKSSTRTTTMTTTTMAAVMTGILTGAASRPAARRARALRGRRPRPRRPARAARRPSSRACHSSPLHRDEPVAAHLAVRADDRLRPDRRRPSPDLDDLGQHEREEQRERARRSRARRGSETWYPDPRGSNRSSEPKTKQAAPASVSAPWLKTTNSSAIQKANAAKIRIRPAQLIGSTSSPKKAIARQRIPNVAGKIRPGCQSSTTIPSTPSESISEIRFGSISVSSIRCQSPS